MSGTAMFYAALGITFGWGVCIGAIVMFRVIAWAMKAEQV